jgi:hypothetical protein
VDLDEARRVTKADLQGECRIEIGLFVVDLDAPKKEATPEWRAETSRRVEQAFAELSYGFFYETQHGARVIWRLAEPFVVQSTDDAASWSRFYLERLAHIERRSGLVGDPTCHDMARIFRLPHATRDPGIGPEQRATLGDPHCIAAISVEIGDDDRARARQLVPRLYEPKRCVDYVFHVPCSVEQGAGVAGDTAAGGAMYAAEGELWELLLERELVVGPCPRGGWVVRCPNQAAHSTGTSGDGSTVFYAGPAGGALHCKHSSCAAVDHGGWLALLEAPKRRRRSVRIVAARENEDCDRLRLEIVPLDGAGAIYPPIPGWPAPRPGPAVLTVGIPIDRGSSAVRRRYESLWSAAGVELPKDRRADGDLGGAVDELRGKAIDLDMLGSKVRRVLPPRAERAA